jgi:glycosyltransferase involved in cell wall biosynthesis
VNVHGKTGYLSNVGEIADMAKNAKLLLEDERKYDQFRMNALRRAKEFDIERILPLYEELYKQLT